MEKDIFTLDDMKRLNIITTHYQKIQGGRYDLWRLDLLVVGCDDVQTPHIVQSEDVFLHRFPPITTLAVGIVIYLYIYGLLGCGFAAVPCWLRGKTRRVLFL